ncbi:Synaptogenesis protein syg-1-like, partial [Homarus americanus]
MSLVVQRVTRGHGGDYTCEASNIKDTSSSPPLHLDVKYAPVCARQERVQHSVAKLENAEISCRVHANPANVTFRWTFNNTAEAIDVPDGRFVVAGTESRVNYTPMNELDYGTLLCWANNTIGLQQHPCVFHIVAAGELSLSL